MTIIKKEYFIFLFRIFLKGLFLIALFAVSFRIYCQEYLVTHYTEDDGLANSTVYDVIQDSTGIMWFATRGGITSYDGLHWKTFNVENEEHNTSFERFFLDKKGVLWAFPGYWQKHIIFYDGKKWQIFGKDITLRQKMFPVASFLVDYEDNDPVIYLGTYDGLYILKNESWLHYSTDEGLPSERINELDSYGEKIYIATEKGICSYADGQIMDESRLNELLPSMTLQGITIEESDSLFIWLAGQNWVCHIKEDTLLKHWNGIPFKTDVKSFFIRLTPDPSGGVYVANPASIFYIPPDSDHIEHLGIINGLITEGASGIIIDREKNLWISTYRGINKISTQRFANYNKTHGLLNNEVTSIVEIMPGEFLLGHHEGVTRFLKNKAIPIAFPKGPEDNMSNMRVLDITLDKELNAWIATSAYGLVMITPDNRIFHYSRFANNENVASVAISPTGKIYVATDHKLFIRKNGEFKPVSVSIDSNITFRKIYFTRDTTLFICTYNGLIKKKDNDWKIIKNTDSTYSNNVYSVYETADGEIYAGTLSGLFCMEKDRLVKFGLGENEINRPVYLIFSDNKDRLWVGTDNGIFRWDGRQLNHYTSNDGLSGQELNRDAGLVDHNGRVMLGTNNGLSIYREKFDYDTTNLPPPYLSIDYLTVGPDTFPLNAPLKLQYFSNNLTFHFTGISFIDEKKLYFECKLDGRDKTWSSDFRTIDNTYRYQDLKAGEYVFRLRAKNALEEWSSIASSPVITILKPIWKQTWFIVAIVLVAAALFYQIWIGVNNRKYARRLRLEVQYRTRELQDSENKLRQLNATKDRLFSIIGHDLKSPFNTILGYSDLLISEYKYLSDEEKLKFIRQIRNSSGKTYALLENLLLWAIAQDGSLKFQPDHIDIGQIAEDNIAMLETSADKKGITLLNGIEKGNFAYADKDMTDTIFRNIISNAIKFTGENGRIVLTAVKKDDKLHINIIDNGKGIPENMLKSIFDPENKDPEQIRNEESGTGIGLMLCKDFVMKNGGSINIRSKEGQGTTVMFTLPLFHS